MIILGSGVELRPNQLPDPHFVQHEHQLETVL